MTRVLVQAQNAPEEGAPGAGGCVVEIALPPLRGRPTPVRAELAGAQGRAGAIDLEVLYYRDLGRLMIRRVGTQLWSVLYLRAAKVAAEAGQQRCLVSLDALVPGGRLAASLVVGPDSRNLPKAPLSQAVAGWSVKSPLTGRVLQILAKERDVCQAGQPILVLEAMKMENRIPAPRTGRLRSLRVRVGQNVHAGDTLCEMEVEPAP